MGDVIKFEEIGIAEPHYQGWCACQSCGYVALHVWPVKTAYHELHCGECHNVGTLFGVWNRANLLLDGVDVKSTVWTEATLRFAGWTHDVLHRRWMHPDGEMWVNEEDVGQERGFGDVEDCHRYPTQGAWARAYMELDGWEGTGLPLLEE